MTGPMTVVARCRANCRAIQAKRDAAVYPYFREYWGLVLYAAIEDLMAAERRARKLAMRRLRRMRRR